MLANSIKVNILSYTENPLDVIHTACSQNYSNESPVESMKKSKNQEFQQKRKFIKECLSSPHHQEVLRHVSITVSIEGISHFLALKLSSFNKNITLQDEQNGFLQSDHGFVTPPSVQSDSELNDLYRNFMIESQESSRRIKTYLMNKFAESSTGSDLKSILKDIELSLPMGAQARIIVTKNVYDWLDFFKKTSCEINSWESKALASEIIETFKKVFPILFENAGPFCQETGICPFPKKDSCGNSPGLNEALQITPSNQSELMIDPSLIMRNQVFLESKGSGHSSVHTIQFMTLFPVFKTADYAPDSALLDLNHFQKEETCAVLVSKSTNDRKIALLKIFSQRPITMESESQNHVTKLVIHGEWEFFGVRRCLKGLPREADYPLAIQPYKHSIVLSFRNTEDLASFCSLFENS